MTSVASPPMQVGHFNLATVVDDYRAIAGAAHPRGPDGGLIGEITDEYDVEEPLIGPHGDGTAQVSARIRIDELKPLLGIDLPAGDRDTAAGLLCALHGHVPGAGETATCRGHALRAERVWAPE